jgi:hypothetical protein
LAVRSSFEMSSPQPWLRTQVSSSSLRGMEIGIPPGQPLPAEISLQGQALPTRLPSVGQLSPSKLPPQPPVGAYVSKPLPPVPKRGSTTSAFSSEVDKALQTSKRSLDYQGTELDWEKEEASISVILENSISEFCQHPGIPRIDIPRTPPDHVLLPQSKHSVRKILQLTSDGKPAQLATSNLSPTSPSGHNSSWKVKQVMGVSIASPEAYSTQGSVSPVSPMSGSSVYSVELAATVSEPDTDTYAAYYSDSEAQLDARSPKWTSRVPKSPSEVPEVMRIGPSLGGRASKHYNRYSDPPISPLSATHPASDGFPGRHHRQDSTDMYHATAIQLAKAPPAPTLPKHWQPAPLALPSLAPNSNVDFNAARRPSFTGRLAASRVRHAPAPAQLPSSSRGEDGPAFGSTGKHPLRTPYPPTAALSPTADAANKSAFDYDSDEKRHSAAAALRRLVFPSRDNSSGVVEIRSPDLMAPKIVRGRWSEEHSDAESVTSERVILTNRSRRADGPDTPTPFLSIVEQARKVTGMKKREDKRADQRREELKGRIRHATLAEAGDEGGSESEAAESKRGRGRVRKWLH